MGDNIVAEIVAKLDQLDELGVVASNSEYIALLARLQGDIARRIEAASASIIR